MLNIKQEIFKKKLNWKYINKVLISRGLKLNQNYKYLNLSIVEEIKRLIGFFEENKEIKEKKNHENILLKFDNGSYKGYKRFRGLPVFNQRTKTNSRTSRKLNY